MCRRLEPSRKHGRKMRSQPAAPGAPPLTRTQTCQRQLQTIKYKRRCWQALHGALSMSSSVVVKRVAVNRERSSRPYTRTELAACCTARCCLLLLPAGLFDDLSDGLFDRLSDCPYDLPLIPPLIASLITKSAPRRGEGGQRPTRRAAPSPESDPAPPEIGRGSKRALTSTETESLTASCEAGPPGYSRPLGR